MKKLIFILSCVFITLTMLPLKSMGQSFPTAPKTQKAKVVTAYMLYKYIGEIKVPVYIQNTYGEVKINYCWYETQSVFGQRARVSEKPYYVEECTYKNGRLTTYKRDQFIFRIEWMDSGQIYRIIKYNLAGEQIKNNGCELYWYDYKDRKLEGRGLTNSSRMYINNVLKTTDWGNNEEAYLEGYDIINDNLVIRGVEALLKRSGHIAKEWIKRKYTKTPKATVYPDGRIKYYNNNNYNPFDFKDPIRCQAIIEQL